MPVVSSKSFEVVNEKVRKGKGPLVKVEIAPGRFVKMYRADAVAQGLIKKDSSEDLGMTGGTKARVAEGDKMLRPSQDKKAAAADTAVNGEAGQGSADTAESGGTPGGADDLTVIEGVGPATARALGAVGIVSFEQLRSAGRADLERVVSGNVLASIEAWQAAEK